MPVANIYFVLGCSKPAAMVSRVLKSNVVTSPFLPRQAQQGCRGHEPASQDEDDEPSEGTVSL